MEADEKKGADRQLVSSLTLQTEEALTHPGQCVEEGPHLIKTP